MTRQYPDAECSMYLLNGDAAFDYKQELKKQSPSGTDESSTASLAASDLKCE